MRICTPYNKFVPAIRDVTSYPCPVSTLPTELLQEIFAFSMTKKPRPRIVAGIPDEELRPTGFQKTALFLTWVCSPWRQIALSMPELWGTMTIYTPKKYSVELVKVYLSRSGYSTPLDLSLSQGPVANHRSYHFPELFPEHEVTVEILKLWIPQAHRWRKIDLNLEITSPLHELPNIPPDALCAVEEADLHFSKTPGHSEDVIERFWGDIFRSPVLRTAYWHNLKQVLPPAPFSQLEEFDLFLPTMDQLFSVLPLCGRLKRLHIASSSKPSVHAGTSSKVAIVLPRLEHLNLSVHEGLVGILEYLTTPGLHELQVYDSSKSPFADVLSLHRFLRRSGCTLQTLKLWDRRNHEEMPLITSLLNASAQLCSLKTLIVMCDQLSEKAVSIFEPRIVGTSWLVPFPSLLDLDISSTVTGDGKVSSMVESRYVAGAPLRTFCGMIKSTPSSTPHYPMDQARFERLQHDGLQLYWASWATC